MPIGALFYSRSHLRSCFLPQLSQLCCSLHQLSQLCFSLPQLSQLVFFLTSAITSGAVFAQGGVSGVWCCFSTPLVFFLPHPASLMLFCTPAVTWCLWCCLLPCCCHWFSFLPQLAFSVLSCPLCRLWCCFLPHLSPLVLFLTQADTTVTCSFLPCCRLPSCFLPQLALFLTPAVASGAVFIPELSQTAFFSYLSSP